jgi:hypothetical protein
MSRILALAVMALLWAIPASAQSPAPTLHPGTKISFAPTVGGAKLEQAVHLNAVPGGRNAGDTYVYSVGKMQLTVDVFDGGRRVPQGSSNPTVANQFETETNTAEQQIKAANYQRFERPTVPSTCTYGSVSFRCIVYSAQTGGTRLYSKMMLTGYNNYFVKINIIWSIADKVTAVEADQALSSFIPALMR